MKSTKNYLTSKVWNPNSRKFFPRNLRNLKFVKLNSHKNLLPHGFKRCGNGERFCLSCNFSAFVSQCQQSHIRELRKIFGQESHHPLKSESARTPMGVRTEIRQLLVKLVAIALSLLFRLRVAIIIPSFALSARNAFNMTGTKCRLGLCGNPSNQRLKHCVHGCTLHVWSTFVAFEVLTSALVKAVWLKSSNATILVFYEQRNLGIRNGPARD